MKEEKKFRIYKPVIGSKIFKNKDKHIKSKEKYFCSICGIELPLLKSEITTELYIPQCNNLYAEGKFKESEPTCMEIIDQINFKRIRRAKKEKRKRYDRQLHFIVKEKKK